MHDWMHLSTANRSAIAARTRLISSSFDPKGLPVLFWTHEEGYTQMATERANALLAFKSLIDEQLAGETIPTVDEVLARWEYENATFPATHHRRSLSWLDATRQRNDVGSNACKSVTGLSGPSITRMICPNR